MAGLPYNNRLGYSKKGWTDGEIGVEWIKEFDHLTSADAVPGNLKYCLLLVDGHNSHYTTSVTPLTLAISFNNFS
jgi:hypothetical protein